MFQSEICFTYINKFSTFVVTGEKVTFIGYSPWFLLRFRNYSRLSHATGIRYAEVNLGDKFSGITETMSVVSSRGQWIYFLKSKFLVRFKNLCLHLLTLVSIRLDQTVLGLKELISNEKPHPINFPPRKTTYSNRAWVSGWSSKLLKKEKETIFYSVNLYLQIPEKVLAM